MKETINIFNTKTTEEVAQYLLGMYLEHETATGVLGGYIVDAEAYLGPDDEAAHSFGLRKTPRLQAMYDKPGTIYLYTMHTHLILNMVTQEQGKPQGVMIRAIEPVEGVDKMIENRQGRQGVELTNGPGKLVAALGIDKQLYGQSIFSSSLRLVPEYVVAGNPYISKQKRTAVDQIDFGWKDEENEKSNNAHILRGTT